MQRVAGDLLRSIHILEALRDMFEYKDDKGRDQAGGRGRIRGAWKRMRLGYGNGEGNGGRGKDGKVHGQARA